jgi:hypothetical protein
MREKPGAETRQRQPRKSRDRGDEPPLALDDAPEPAPVDYAVFARRTAEIIIKGAHALRKHPKRD